MNQETNQISEAPVETTVTPVETTATATVETAPAPTEVIEAPVGNTTVSAESFLPDDYKNDPTFKDYKSLNDLLKSYKHLESKIGLKELKAPDENAPSEYVQKYREALGVPQDPNGYEMGFEYDSTIVPEIKEIFDLSIKDSQKLMHEYNIPKKTGEVFMERYYSDMAQIYQDVSKYYDNKIDAEFIQGVKERFGSDYEHKFETAKSLITKYGDPADKDLYESLDSKSLIAMVNIMNNINKSMSEGKFVTGGSASSVSLEDLHKRYLEAKDPQEKAELAKQRGQYLASLLTNSR